MKPWHFAALLLVLGIGYVVVSQMTATRAATQARVNQNSNTSNALFGVIGSAAAGLFSKISAPSAKPGGSTSSSGFGWFGGGDDKSGSQGYDTTTTPVGDLDVVGNVLVDDTGSAVEYGPY